MKVSSVNLCLGSSREAIWSRHCFVGDKKQGRKDEKYVQSHTTREQLLKKVVGESTEGKGPVLRAGPGVGVGAGACLCHPPGTAAQAFVQLIQWDCHQDGHLTGDDSRVSYTDRRQDPWADSRSPSR